MLENVSVIIPVAADEMAHKPLLNALEKMRAEVIVISEGTRARSLNLGAEKAQNTFLWFLHADSIVNEGVLLALQASLKEQPNSLHYFKLAYSEAGFSTLNAIGANLRCLLWGLPYGDQGLCISKDLFFEVGCYPENSDYGEDLLSVRKAKTLDLLLKCISTYLYTSARKYHQIGWLKLTLIRQLQVIKLIRKDI